MGKNPLSISILTTHLAAKILSCETISIKAQTTHLLGGNANIPRNHWKTSLSTIFGPQKIPENLLQPFELSPVGETTWDIINIGGLESAEESKQ